MFVLYSHHFTAVDVIAKINFTAKPGKNFVTFLFTGWSAPSAIGIAGLGGGFEVGAEVTVLCWLTVES